MTGLKQQILGGKKNGVEKKNKRQWWKTKREPKQNLSKHFPLKLGLKIVCAGCIF